MLAGNGKKDVRVSQELMAKRTLCWAILIGLLGSSNVAHQYDDVGQNENEAARRTARIASVTSNTASIPGAIKQQVSELRSRCWDTVTTVRVQGGTGIEINYNEGDNKGVLREVVMRGGGITVSRRRVNISNEGIGHYLAEVRMIESIHRDQVLGIKERMMSVDKSTDAKIRA